MGLIAGILLILISIAHNLYGKKKQIPVLKEISKDSIIIIISSQRIMIFQGGIFLFSVGIVQVLTSLNIIFLTGIAQNFPVGIVVIMSAQVCL
ncbi:hypothetical protein [Algoriphagus antarcticus]|uniref:Uncharacterized protein n=1 Tax=Algoriphagus antarcticus TaxID=238540 RepID=A0A3E0E3C5_9BACT|nr:hypothetical protein [Algoriphagus antarcticus]REG92782.1 hypothetical protein C8N25_102185 [Algoriphagus antarcticus]